MRYLGFKCYFMHLSAFNFLPSFSSHVCYFTLRSPSEASHTALEDPTLNLFHTTITVRSKPDRSGGPTAQCVAPVIKAPADSAHRCPAWETAGSPAVLPERGLAFTNSSHKLMSEILVHNYYAAYLKKWLRPAR